MKERNPVTRSRTSTPRLAGLAALALSAATLAVPMTSAAPASAQDEPGSIQAANDKVTQWIAKHEGKLKLSQGDKLVRTATLQAATTPSPSPTSGSPGPARHRRRLRRRHRRRRRSQDTSVAQTAPDRRRVHDPTLGAGRGREIARGQLTTVAGRRGHRPGRLQRPAPPAASPGRPRSSARRRGRQPRSPSTSTRRPARCSAPRSTSRRTAPAPAASTARPVTLDTTLSGSTYTHDGPDDHDR